MIEMRERILKITASELQDGDMLYPHREVVDHCWTHKPWYSHEQPLVYVTWKDFGKSLLSLSGGDGGSPDSHYEHREVRYRPDDEMIVYRLEEVENESK